MRIDEIIKLAKHIKVTYGSNPIDIANKIGVGIGYTNLNPKVYPAYTINTGKPMIILNNYFSNKSQNILAAHELGHALLHNDNYYNGFGDTRNSNEEFEANLFAVTLLFNEDDFNVKFKNLSNYDLKGLLDLNIEEVI